MGVVHAHYNKTWVWCLGLGLETKTSRPLVSRPRPRPRPFFSRPRPRPRPFFSRPRPRPRPQNRVSRRSRDQDMSRDITSLVYVTRCRNSWVSTLQITHFFSQGFFSRGPSIAPLGVTRCHPHPTHPLATPLHNFNHRNCLSPHPSPITPLPSTNITNI